MEFVKSYSLFLLLFVKQRLCQCLCFRWWLVGVTSICNFRANTIKKKILFYHWKHTTENLSGWNFASLTPCCWAMRFRYDRPARKTLGTLIYSTPGYFIHFTPLFLMNWLNVIYLESFNRYQKNIRFECCLLIKLTD